MIKRVRFATRKEELQEDAFPDLWREAVSVAARAPRGDRPWRIAAATSLPYVLPDPIYDGIGIEWFDTAEHLERFEQWLVTPDGGSLTRRLDKVLDLSASPVVTMDELVLRGADWLDDRWREGTVKIKHMAIARRAADLTPAEFSERWKGRAGTLGTASGPVVAIPEEARGRAYVQNHPRPNTGAGPYDALNEVYFDDVRSLRVRIDWFEQNLRDQAETDLVAQSWFIAAREEVLWETHPLEAVNAPELPFGEVSTTNRGSRC
jgi:hypothetical protein